MLASMLGDLWPSSPVSVHTQNMSWIRICWWSFLSLSLAVKFLTFWDQYSTAQKYLVVAKFWRYFHEIKARWNTEISSHLIIRLWLANKKTSSNQRGANGVTAASWQTENHARILGASNAGFRYFWGLALRVLDGIQAEITTLKREMDNKDPENEDPSNANAKCDWMTLT